MKAKQVCLWMSSSLIGVLFSCSAQSAQMPADAWLFGINQPPQAILSGKQQTPAQLGSQLQVGDLVFIRAKPLPFRKVADATNSWTNHVGVVVEVSGAAPVIAESTFPVSRYTSLARFVARSEEGRVAVLRPAAKLSVEQQQGIRAAAARRQGVFYDTGFNLDSKGQFCSRLVHEVMQEGAGISLGKVETFSDLLKHNPSASQTFWKVWFFGRVPWNRKTITPASLLASSQVQPVFDGWVK